MFCGVGSAPSSATEPAGDVDVFAQARESLWSLQPIRRPAMPVVTDPAWIATPVDAFVLAQLDAVGLTPSMRAERRTLIRRATIDLLGLPPSPDEVDAFVNDDAPDAYARLIDRLLASPRYGERWARHWLDVARYADTKGYVFQEDRRYAYAYTYRDYVIRALNDDLPFDRFVTEQLAADRLELGDDNRALAALGFLTVGRRFSNNRHDIIDDRIDVVTRGLMGLTVQCARCHDHKFDAIKTTDYYALYGVFASSDEPKDMPMIGHVEQTEKYKAFMAELDKRKKARDDYRDEKHAALLVELRGQVTDYLLAVARGDKPINDAYMLSLSPGEIRSTVVRSWRRFINKTAKQHHPVFAPWHALSAIDDDTFANEAEPVLAALTSGTGSGNSPGPINALIKTALEKMPPKSMADVARIYGTLIADADAQWKKLLAEKHDKPPTALPDADTEALRQVLYADDTPTALDLERASGLFDRETNNKLNELSTAIGSFEATSPEAPARAMVLVDAATPYDPRVFERGNPARQGAAVPRRFPQLLAGKDPPPFTNGSGRLEMARAIVADDNPLTARVLVNRVWLWHFGRGLVNTPSDFGNQGEPPTHPALLDYLAWTFKAQGWSIKNLHRTIMLSNTYQQAGDDREDALAGDPENRLLWRMNRRRMAFETLRDSLLAVAGRLDTTQGGTSVRLFREPFTTRRAVYGYIDRQDLPGTFRIFDLASPDSSTPKRFVTTVPQQALYLMNNPFVIEQARHLIARPDVASLEKPAQRVAWLYRLINGRDATPDEVRLAERFIARQADQPDGAQREPQVWRYGYGEYDADKQRLMNFTALPNFSGEQWQGGGTYPNPELHFLALSRTGGHVGVDVRHAAVRRWVAPIAGVVRIESTLSHESEKGDGVRAWIVSRRAGELGHWTVHNTKVSAAVERVTVQPGDTIDFVVDCRTEHGYDSFTWAPALHRIAADVGAATLAATSVTLETWDARADFGGPVPEPPKPLNAWVLLLANEFVFVD
jgi:hypothetical protein